MNKKPMLNTVVMRNAAKHRQGRAAREILRCAQDDGPRWQDDRSRGQDDGPRGREFG